jgi:subtilisin family serine protease
VAFDWLGRRLDVQPPFDAGEHGTHIAGTLVGGQTADGISIGVAPQATLYSAAVLLGTPSIEGFLSGVDWVTIEHNVDLINMSLSIQYYDPDLEHRFKRLWISGHIPVAAIGNRRYGASDSPGNLTAVVGVGATDNRDGVASFSGGATLSKYDPAGSKYVHEVKPDVAAPGVEVYSCVPHQPQGLKYKKMSGTSMAAPHVTGVLALLLQATRNRKRKRKTPAQIVRILYRTAQQLGDPGHNNRYGRGLIDPAAALTKV